MWSINFDFVVGYYILDLELPIQLNINLYWGRPCAEKCQVKYGFLMTDAAERQQVFACRFAHVFKVTVYLSPTQRRLEAKPFKRRSRQISSVMS